MQSRKIGVLLGGLSSEREVSLRSGEAVVQALCERGHHAVPIYVDHDPAARDASSAGVGSASPGHRGRERPLPVDVALRQHGIEVAFLALHGRWGEDGCIQGLLEMLGIPYTGSDVMASALAMHKAKAKELFRLHNLATPPYYTLRDPQRATRRSRAPSDLAALHGDFGFPCVVKPVREGSSVGVTVCGALDELAAAIERALRFDDEILVERYVAGREISVAVVGERALGGIEIAPRGGFYDYRHKYALGTTDYYVPPRVSPERYRGILAQALRAHLALGCTGATRIDLIVSDTGNESILEVNTLPGLTPTSLLPRIAEAAGMSFGELCETILAGATLGSRRGRGERRIAQRAFAGNDRRADLRALTAARGMDAN